MRLTSLILFSIFFIFSLCNISYAGSKQITGKVISISPKDNSIIIQGRKGIIEVTPVEKTTVIAEVIKEISDVEVGDKVTVKYQVKGRRNTAKKITIRAEKQKVLKDSSD